jgi:hypothetical protein
VTFVGAKHCGVAADAVAASLTQTGSLVRTALTLRAAGHYLAPVNEAAVPPPPLSALESLADPDGPIPPPRFLETIVGERPKARPLRRLAKVIVAGAVIVALMLAWRFTPLASLARPDTIRQWLAAVAQAPAAPLLVIAAFVGGGLVVFPVVVLIAATAAAFGPWLGFVYAFAGALASAIVTYAVGAAIGREALGRAARARAPCRGRARGICRRGDKAGSDRAVHAGQHRGGREQGAFRGLSDRHRDRHGARDHHHVGARLSDLEHRDQADPRQCGDLSRSSSWLARGHARRPGADPAPPAAQRVPGAAQHGRSGAKSIAILHSLRGAADMMRCRPATATNALRRCRCLRSLGRSRISGAPLRARIAAQIGKALVPALALHRIRDTAGA